MSARQIILNQVMRFADPADMDVGNWDICTDNILSALDAAGYTPPMHIGAVHRALQDAFQAGVNEAFAGKYIRTSADIVALKHKICDGILHELTAAKLSETKQRKTP